MKERTRDILFMVGYAVVCLAGFGLLAFVFRQADCYVPPYQHRGLYGGWRAEDKPLEEHIVAGQSGTPILCFREHEARRSGPPGSFWESRDAMWRCVAMVECEE